MREHTGAGVRRVLIAVDGSESCHHVADHGYELAAALGVPATILHVVEDLAVPIAAYGLEPYVDVEGVGADVVAAQRQTAERLVHAVAAAAPAGVDPDPVVAETSGRRIGETIAEEAAERGAGLIVLGTHGHRGLSRLLLGSVADAVVRLAEVPVTLVRAHSHDHGPG